MKRSYNMGKSKDSHVLSKNAWLLIILSVLFLVYVFVDPVNNALNSLFNTMFSPLIELFEMAGGSLKYFN